MAKLSPTMVAFYKSFIEECAIAIETHPNEEFKVEVKKELQKMGKVFEIDPCNRYRFRTKEEEDSLFTSFDKIRKLKKETLKQGERT